VGDEDDARAGVAELTHDDHELVGLLGGQHGGRLVEDEDLGVARERLDDLDALLHADRELLDDGVGVDVEAEAPGDLAHLRAGGLQVEPPAGAGLLVAQHHVLRHGEDGDEHEVLVHHADARRHGVAGAGEPLDDVVEQDLALVGLVQAVQHVHERGLARAVLAEQRVDLSRFDDEVDVIVGHEAAEALGDAAEFELHNCTLSRGVRGRRASGIADDAESAE